LQGNELKNALTIFFDEYATDTVVEKLLPFANSQRNESLNSVIGSKKTKTAFMKVARAITFGPRLPAQLLKRTLDLVISMTHLIVLA
jgi:hypothetical protein